MQEENLLSLPLELRAHIAQYLPLRDLLTFSQAHTHLMQAARITASNNPQAAIQMLSDQLVDLLRGNTARMSQEKVEAIWRLHKFYVLCGGRASLSLMKQKADELNKRVAREKILDKLGENSGMVTMGLCWWTTACWIGFGCCCSSNPCCCAASIATSVLCCGSYTLNQASRYEKNNNVFRARFCDAEYDLEAHPGNDFQSVLPPHIQMEAAQEAFQPILIEQDEQPNCFTRAINFFRPRAANNPNIENIELVERFEH